MKLLTARLRKQLLKNGAQSADTTADITFDPWPVVKFFNPAGIGTWLITEADPHQPDRLFGLCDLGSPELGYVFLSDLAGIRLPGGLRIERDLHWKAAGPLSAYAEQARKTGRIVA